MKKYILQTLLFSLVSPILVAQVGINTENIGTHIFQIDTKSNDSTTGDLTDDFVIDANGKVGIGTPTPQAKLHIISNGKGALKIDNNQTVQAGYVLTSDSQGNATLQELGLASSPLIFTDTGVNIDFSEANYVDTHAYIDLKPGKWMLKINMDITAISNATTNRRGTLKFTFADDTTIATLTPTEDIITSSTEKYLSATSWLGMSNQERSSAFNGQLIINNSNTSAKRYYLLSGKVEYTGTTLTGSFNNVGMQDNTDVVIAIRIK